MAFKFLNRGGKEERAEMSFIDHLEALRGHLFRAVISIAVGAVIVGVNNKFVIKKILLGPTHADFPTYKFLCKMGNSLRLGNALCMNEMGVKMQSTAVAGQFSMWFTVVLIGGIILAFPYIFYFQERNDSVFILETCMIGANGHRSGKIKCSIHEVLFYKTKLVDSLWFSICRFIATILFKSRVVNLNYKQ